MIILVTGGARSGKSSFAENLYKDKDDVVYMATAKTCDKEMKERVKHHQETRPASWRTYEGNYGLKEALRDEKHYLLDCVTVMTSNIMFDITKDMDYIDFEIQREIEDTILKEIKELIDEIREKDYHLVLVTNELGYSIVPDHHISRVFRDVQGRINQKLAALCDEVYLVACGLPVKLK